jgi:succinylglutamate desuccinylase
MNRCFLLQELSDPSLSNREQARAKQLNELLGPKASGSWGLSLFTIPTAAASMKHSFR